MPLQGHHAFITGGSRGIGLACARALLAQGARVTIAGRDASALDLAAAPLRLPAAADVGSGGGREPVVATCILDVTDQAAVQAAIAAAAQQSGPITILLNNA